MRPRPQTEIHAPLPTPLPSQEPRSATLDFYLHTAENMDRLVKDVNQTVFDYGRSATGHIRIAVNPSDGDTVTITVSGTLSGSITRVFEAESTGGVGGGNIAFTIGANAAATAANLRAAIVANIDASFLSAAVHSADTTVIDLIVTEQGAALTLSESTAGARIVVKDNGEERPERLLYMYTLRRQITTEDVNRGRVRINTGLSAIDAYILRIRTSATNNAEVGYNGTITVTGGVIELDDDGTVDLANNNILDIWIVGTAAE